MEEVFTVPADQPLDAVLVHHERVSREHDPRVRERDIMILKNGPRAYRVAKHHTIVDEHTGEIHHHSVTIDTYDRTKAEWRHRKSSQLTITDQGEDEIGRLLTFLGAVRDGLPHEDGNYLMVRIGDNLTRSDVQRMMSALSSGERASLMAQALASVDGEPATLKAISEVAVSNPAASRAAAAVINLTQMSAALKDLRRLVDANASEHELQRHLTRHPWLFGSEYSERLPDRKWTRDEQQDFMLRRTIDGYIELIEIKTTLSGADLFRLDRSHSTYVPCAQLTAAQSQVENYLERIDADRYAIQARDREDPNKIRAKLIIGRDGNDAQQAALRRHNGHIHRIEIITFDQLIRVGERVIQNLQGVVSPLSKKPETTRPRMCSPVPGQPPLSPSAFDDVPF